MKQGRGFAISNKVVTSADLRRLGEIFQRQGLLARKSEHHFSIKYRVTFSDGTIIESDTTDALDDDALTAFPARPITATMTFDNYSLNRGITLSLTNGTAIHGNAVAISSSEPTWLAETFDSLKNCVDGMRPQKSWVQKYSVAIVFLSAVSYVV